MEIERLLERYFEGETSLKEEQTLREYFRGKTIAGHLEQYRAIFSAFEEDTMEKCISPDFEQKVTASLSPHSGKIVSLMPVRKKILYISSIAASILLLAGLFLTYRGELPGNSSPRLTASQQIAFEEAATVLKIVSNNFNAGLKQVEYVTKIESAMKNVTMFNKFYEYESRIIHPDILINKSTKNK
jgi:hypothetical protein